MMFPLFAVEPTTIEVGFMEVINEGKDGWAVYPRDHRDHAVFRSFHKWKAIAFAEAYPW